MEVDDEQEEHTGCGRRTADAEKRSESTFGAEALV
jgi:hypothetical protein